MAFCQVNPQSLNYPKLFINSLMLLKGENKLMLFIQIFVRLSIEYLTKNSYFKLECLGIDGSYLLAWCRSYLSGRRHRVVLDNESSDVLPVTSEVPQGSILGPLLFLIFINDMPNVISKETSQPLFADDSKCFRLILRRDDGDKLQDDLNQTI